MMQRKDERAIRAIHIIFAVAIPILLFSLLSCKRAKEEPMDLGPEVDPKLVQKALDEVFTGNTYINGQEGQYVFYEETLSVGGGAARPAGYEFVQVEKREDVAANPHVTLNMYYQRKKLKADNSGYDVVETREAYDVKRATDADAMSSPLEIHKFSAKSMKAMVREGKADRVTYHNFSVERGPVVAVPEAVKQRTGCGGLANCSLNSVYIKVDEVKWYGEDYDIYHYDLAYTKDTPFLINTVHETQNGLMLIGCLSTYVLVEGVKAYVRDCITLKDFQK